MAAQCVGEAGSDCSEMKYEDKNFFPPKTLVVNEIRGRVVRDSTKMSITNICVGIFDEETRKLVAVLMTDESGNFAFDKLKTGKYRLVVIDDITFDCTANIPIELKDSDDVKKSLLVTMRYPSLDICSSGKLVDDLATL